MKRQDQETLETPIASLIDVVFLLIIFFVVTAAVQKDIVDENIKLAEAKHVAAVERSNSRTVTINVRRDGEVNIALHPYSLTALTNLLSTVRQESGDSVPIVIRGDGKALYREVDKVMEAIGRAHLYRVKLSAEATGDGK